MILNLNIKDEGACLLLSSEFVQIRRIIVTKLSSTVPKILI